jgi:hypothetical protein
MTYDEFKKVDMLVASPAESITSQDSEDQERPPLPVDELRLNSIGRQVPIVLGPVTTTDGCTGLEGAEIKIVVLGVYSQVEQSEISDETVHSAVSVLERTERGVSILISDPVDGYNSIIFASNQ